MKFSDSELRKHAWEAEGRAHTSPGLAWQWLSPGPPCLVVLEDSVGKQQEGSSAVPPAAPSQPPASCSSRLCLPRVGMGLGRGCQGNGSCCQESSVCLDFPGVPRHYSQKVPAPESSVSAEHHVPPPACHAISPICPWGTGGQLFQMPLTRAFAPS